MQIGAVLPHNEIGSDPGAIRAYVAGRRGARHDAPPRLRPRASAPTRTARAGSRACTTRTSPSTSRSRSSPSPPALTRTLEFASTVLILPQRQAVLVAKQAAEVAIVSGDRLRLGIGTGWNTVEYVSPERDDSTIVGGARSSRSR